MADNVIIDPGAGGATIATDDIADVHYQRVKLVDSTADSTTPTGVSANPLRVDPTGSTAQPVTDNGGALSIDDGGNIISVDDGGGVLSVDDNGASLTVDGTVAISGAIDTELPAAAALGDNTANPTVPGVGSFDHVWDGANWDRLPGNSTDGALVNLGANNDVTLGAALPAGNNNIGDVDIVSLPDEGQQTMANSISVAIASNQSAVPVSDNGGALTVDNAGTFAVQDSEKIADNNAFTDGTTRLQPAGYIFDETAGTALTENDAAAARIDSKRAQVAVIEDETTRGRRTTVTAANALKVDGSAVTQPVSGTVTANLAAGTNNIGDVDVLSIAAGDNNIGNVDIVTLPNLNESLVDDAQFTPASSRVIPVGFTFDDVAVDSVNENDIGAARMSANRNIYTTIRDAAGNERGVNVDANNNLNVAQATASSLNAQVVGNIAHDTGDAGNPVKVGGRALAHGTNPTAVTAADRTDWLFNRAGVPWVMGGHPNIVTVEAAYTAAQTDTAIVTIATGLIIVVTQIQATCDNANTVDVGFRVGFGTANTPTTTGVVLTHPGVAPGSGVSRGDGSGIIGIGTDNQDLRVTSEVPTTGSFRVLVSYYTIET